MIFRVVWSSKLSHIVCYTRTMDGKRWRAVSLCDRLARKTHDAIPTVHRSVTRRSRITCWICEAQQEEAMLEPTERAS